MANGFKAKSFVWMKFDIYGTENGELLPIAENQSRYQLVEFFKNIGNRTAVTFFTYTEAGTKNNIDARILAGMCWEN